MNTFAENTFNLCEKKEIKEAIKKIAFRFSGREVGPHHLVKLLSLAGSNQLNPLNGDIVAYEHPEHQDDILAVISDDSWYRLVTRHPDFEGIEFKPNKVWIQLDGAMPCPSSMEGVIERKGCQKIRVTVHLDEHYHPSRKWKEQTKQMLQLKALIQCARLALGFAGLFDQDEYDRLIRKVDSEDKSELPSQYSFKQLMDKVSGAATAAGLATVGFEYFKIPNSLAMVWFLALVFLSPVFWR